MMHRLWQDYVILVLFFVPSCDGLSHNPKEYTRDEHIEAGTRVLYKTLSALLEA